MLLFIRPLLFFTLIQHRRYDNFQFFKAVVSITTDFQFKSYSIPKTNITFFKIAIEFKHIHYDNNLI